MRDGWRWGWAVLAGWVALGAGCERSRVEDSMQPPEQPKPTEAPPPRAPPVWESLVFPTDQQELLSPPTETVFQPTASGRLESALYGSVRTAQRGGRLVASFHEGIDIAPLRHDRQGRPLDSVYAVATGRVAYVNARAGNSTYGIYVVVAHDDPMGTIYTLYAHLAQATARAGDVVAPGSALGRLGNTATYAIPMSRAHLHFEIGVMLNRRFAAWFDQQELKPSHERYHGWNLVGVDPLAMLARHRANPTLSFSETLDATPEAFSWVIRASRLPDYFQRYPSRWRGPAYAGGAMILVFSENGVPLHGRNADADAIARLGQNRAAVLAVCEEALGRNGARLITRKGSKWEIASAGARHLEILLY